MKRSFHSRASRDVRPRRRSAARRDVVSPGERLVRVEHVGRVEGDSTEPVATRPLVWNFSTFQPFNTSTSYYTHDMRPRRRRRVARRSVATEPRSGRKRPRNKNVSDVVAFDGLLAAHYEYAPFGVVIVGTGTASFGGCGCLILHEVLHTMGLKANEKEYKQGNYRRDNAMVLLARELLKGSKFNCKGYDIK